MGTIHRFDPGRRRRAPTRRAAATGWREAARGLGPILFALPLAAFTAVWFLGGFPPADAASPEASGADTVRKHFARCAGAVRITCVVDGDTIWLEGDKIRIADIDTPEISQPRCAREERLGQQATERLIVLLNAAPFELRPNPDGRDEDRYGRKLRVLARGGESIGGMLVAEGLAHEWGGGKRSWC